MLKSTIKVLVVMAKEKTVNMFDADLNLMIHRVLNKVKLAGMIISLAVLSLPSCQNLDSIYDRLDQLETSVSDLQSTCKLLQAAYDQGKIIKSVKPLTNHDTGGWLIVFSDGSEIIVINGNDGQDGIDGITPFLKIDQEGYWTVSYDNGATFIALLDKDGNKIPAIGCDGKDGNEGLSIRLVVNESGYYVVQTYRESEPDVVINEIVTPYTADASRIISLLEQDDKTHIITMTLADGREYTFNMHYVLPTSIAMLAVNPIVLTNGTQASIEFRVNPSNALFNIDGDSCQVVLDNVSAVSAQTHSSYVKETTNYKLVRIEQVYDGETEEMRAGQYRAIIEDTKVSAEYDEMAALVLNVVDANGDPVQISSSAFRIVGQNFENLPKTGLPIVVINTPNSVPINSKDEYVAGSMISVINDDMTFDLQGEMKIKGRGNTTWMMPKKPYKIKFDKKESVLGEAKDKEWVLLANYSDKTQLRNALAFYMGHNSLLDYTSSYHFVELVINGVHKGTYMLAEQQKIAEDRVNVGDDGFLLEVDAKAEETDVTFKTKNMWQQFNIKDPDVVKGDENYNYVSSFVSTADAVLYSENFTDTQNGYTQYIDDDSFVEWYLINEIARNNDATMYTSCYMNLARDGKIKMGPLWDFDIAYGNINYNNNWLTEGFWIKNANWISRMFQDPAFVQKVKTCMTYYYENKQKWLNHIDQMANYLNNSQVVNEDIWQTMNVYVWPNYEVCGSYDAEVQRLKQWLSDRIDWLQANIQMLQ